MFDQELWRSKLHERLMIFARNPRQEIQLAGAPNLLSYLVVQTLAPFFEAFQENPIEAVQTLALVTAGPGANQLVRQAARRPYQWASQTDRDLRGSSALRVATERLMVELQTLEIARRLLSGSREEWLRTTLLHDLDGYPGEFTELRRQIVDPAGHSRVEILRRLRASEGCYTVADLVVLQESLADSSAPVRTQAARLLGLSVGSLPPLLVHTLVQIALHDRDVETRLSAARSIGMLRNHIVSPQLLELLSTHLFAEDRFHRAAAALVLGQLGPYAGSPALVHNLAVLLEDDDPYAREAAARALGGVGLPAATPEVILALTRATQDAEVQVHEAASDALAALKDAQTQEFALALSA